MSSSGGGAVLMQVRGARPIPVGHRVEIRVFYSAEGSGFFGTGAPVPQHDSPLITDLETGIGYGSLEHFHPTLSVYMTGQTFPLSHAPMPGLQEHSRWFGKVIVCNVVHTGMTKNEIQTTLLLEPIAPPNPGYR
jgi:hypothetical protein